MTFESPTAGPADFTPSRPAARAGEAEAHGGFASALWRRRATFVLVFLAVLAATIVALLVLPVQYVATGSVIVAEQEPGDTKTSPVWAQKLGDPADMESQLLVIGSSRVMQAAMAASGMVETAMQDCLANREGGPVAAMLGPSRSGCERLKTDSAALIDYIRPRYSIAAVGRSRVIDVSYRSPRPELAQKMADALIAAFLEDQRKGQSSSRRQAAEWLWGEVRRLDGELRDDDAKIQAYRRSKGLARGQTAIFDSERLTGITQQLAAAERARAEAAARLEEIASNKGRGRAHSPAVMASRAVSDLKQQLTAIEARYAAATSTLGERHPALRELRRERDIVRGRFDVEVAAVAASAKRDLRAAETLVASLKAKAEAAKAEVGDAMIDEGSIEALVRGVDIKRREYSEVYKRASELEADRLVLQGSTRLVSMADLPAKPYFPKRLPFLAAGLTLALLLGATAAILQDRADKSLRGSAGLSAATGDELHVELPRLPGEPAPRLLGLLPRRAADPPLRRALTLAASDEAAQRALFDLYRAAFPGGGEEAYRILAVTSPARGDGKTFLTLALAQFVARMGQSVLVVECDAGDPSFESALGLAAGPGLLEVLNEGVHMREAVVATSMRHLDALPIGRAREESSLPIGKRIDSVLKWTRSYDLVLIDCPPAATLDARLLATRAEGALLCARAGRSSAGEALAAAEQLRAGKSELLALVVNRVERESAHLLERFARVAS
jgi:uncharacterized protein involved in exopolysaccharide biosynthesis/Mrp family chromosome partitioning ATPase